MTDINDVLYNATQWTTEGITKPQIKTGQIATIRLMRRGIVVMKVTSDDELVGVVDRHAYSIDSHDVWVASMVSMTSAEDLEAIIGCIKRIIAEYGQVVDEETYLNWAGGEYKIWNNKRWEFRFAIMRMKSLQTEF